MQLKIWLVALAVALSSVFRTSTTENTVHRSSSNLLAEGLGLLLGLPFRDMNVGSTQFHRTPEFLWNLYNCKTSEGLQNCMQDEEKTREQLEHADIIRNFIGKSKFIIHLRMHEASLPLMHVYLTSCMRCVVQITM